VHPSVDMDRLTTPAAHVSTALNNTPQPTARRLIKEEVMRHTTRSPSKLSLAALLFATACMGQVGGDDGGSRPKQDSDTPAGCENPTEVTEPITIRSDADFAQVPTTCWDLYAKLRIEGPGIGSLSKLGSLKGVNDLEIVDTNLKTIDTKLPLAVYGAVVITGNKQLASLANMPIDNADNLTATYTVRNNPLLASLDGLKYIKAVEGELRISDNAALAEITLDELTSVTGALTIANTGATRIDLGSLQSVGRLEIAGNTKLTTFDGLAASSIKGDFVLRGNPALASLGVMSSVTRVEGALMIEGNNALKNLDAFTSLQYIASSLTVTNNTALETLGRFNRLAGIGTTVAITGNTLLPHCAGHEIVRSRSATTNPTRRTPPARVGAPLTNPPALSTRTQPCSPPSSESQ
jgi:hypothetical protein